jgi:hypothetical protein
VARKKALREPSELVPKSVCTRLEIALVVTGTISNAQAKRIIAKGGDAPDDVFDEVGVMCGWDVRDEARKARVRKTLERYLRGTPITFFGVPNGGDRVTQIREALYGRVAKKRSRNR